MSYTTSKSLYLNNRDFFVGTNSYDSTTVPSNEVKITASDAAASDFFGYDVAVYFNRILVGAYGDNSLVGAAYIFDLDGNEIAKIIASDAAAGDQFGKSVAIGSGRIVIGADFNDDAGTSSGSAYIFDLNGNEITKITASDAAASDRFGVSVAIGSGRIVVGAFGDNSLRGAAYIFDLDGNQLAKIVASDGATGDFFGFSIAIGSGRIVVGAYADDDSGSSSGSAYIFDLDGNQLSKLTASDAAAGDAFGISVAIGSGRIVVGAMGDDDAGESSGAAYVFDLDGNQLTKLTASDAAAGDRFGYDVAIDLGRIVVGADRDNSLAGAAYVFDLEGNQIAKIVSSDIASSDFFGTSVAIGSGKIVVGAYGNDDGGSSSGSAYIYDTPIQKHFLGQLD